MSVYEDIAAGLKQAIAMAECNFQKQNYELDELKNEGEIIEKLFKVMTEFDARWFSSNSVIQEYQGAGWKELCDIGIDLFRRLKE